jgi:hypothetical protein
MIANQLRLVLLVLRRIGVIAGRDRILAADLAINALDLQLTTTSILKHLFRCCRLSLRIV